MVRKHWSAVALMLLLAGGVTACGGEDEDTAGEEAGEAIEETGDEAEEAGDEAQEEMEE